MFRTPFTIDEERYLETRAKKDEIRTAWRKRHGIAESDIVFLTVGKLSPRKRQMDLVYALVRAREHNGAPMRVVMAGDGSERAAIEEQAKKCGLPVNILGVGSPARVVHRHGLGNTVGFRFKNTVRFYKICAAAQNIL